MLFEVNGFKKRSALGIFWAKSTYGYDAVLVRTSPDTDGRVSSVPVICAVEAKGHFFVEEGGTYQVCGFTETFVDRRTYTEKRHDRIRARRVLAMREGSAKGPLTCQGRAVKRDATYQRFLGLFLKLFQNVSTRDANREWYRIPSLVRGGKTPKELVRMVRRSGKYQLTQDGEAEFFEESKRVGGAVKSSR